MAVNIDEVYSKALELSLNVDGNFFELGRSLRHLLDRDPDKFRNVVEKTNLGMRKAYYLVNVARWFEGVRVKRERLMRIGWTKLQLIGPKLEGWDLDELLALAETNTATALKRILKGDKPLKDAHCVLMYFSPEQYQVLEEVLVRHGATANRRGMNDKEAALIAALQRVPKTLPKLLEPPVPKALPKPAGKRA